MNAIQKTNQDIVKVLKRANWPAIRSMLVYFGILVYMVVVVTVTMNLMWETMVAAGGTGWMWLAVIIPLVLFVLGTVLYMVAVYENYVTLEAKK